MKKNKILELHAEWLSSNGYKKNQLIAQPNLKMTKEK